MPKIESSKLKYSILFVLLTISLYFISIYLNNYTKLVINMSSGLSPKIYYSSNNEPFSEQKSITPYKIENNLYIFKMPKAKIDTIRFDPSQRANLELHINSIKQIENRWFKEKLFNIPINNLKPRHQIKDFYIKDGKVNFKTTGLDSQLSLDYKLTNIYNIRNYHLQLFMLTLLISTLIIYLIYIYKTEKFNESLTTKLVLYTIFLAFIAFKANYYKDNVHFGYPPDESQHFKYVEYVDKHKEFIPKFENMPHYLAHPPLYYNIVSFELNKSKSHRDNVSNIRTLSMLIYLFAVILILYLGFSAKLGVLGDFVYLSFISSIPMHSYLGGSITNDTLAILGTIITTLALKRLIDKSFNFTTYLILAVGIFLSFFAKLTAALLIFFALFYYILTIFIKKEKLVIRKKDIALLIVILIPIFYYQISIMLNYHAITPTYNVTHPDKFLHSGFYTDPKYRVHLTPLEWAQRMLHYIQGGWFGIHSHHSFGHSKWGGVFGLVILHIMAIMALFIKCKGDNANFCKLGKITLVALFTVLVVQYLFSYKAHINNGYMGGLQPRYVLPFMFAFAIMASIFTQKYKKYFWFTIFIIVISIQALYSDFFYFLQYYN